VPSSSRLAGGRGFPQDGETCQGPWWCAGHPENASALCRDSSSSAKARRGVARFSIQPAPGGGRSCRGLVHRCPLPARIAPKQAPLQRCRAPLVFSGRGKAPRSVGRSRVRADRTLWPGPWARQSRSRARSWFMVGGWGERVPCFSTSSLGRSRVGPVSEFRPQCTVWRLTALTAFAC